MRTLTLILALASVSHAADYPGVFQMGGGTASCVEGKYLLTCIHGLTNESEFWWDSAIGATIVHRQQYNSKLPHINKTSNAHSDGVAVWKLAGKSVFKSLKLAEHPPKKGDRVSVPGYGHGRFRLKHGTVRSVGTDMILNLSVIPGDSGAPVLNSDGELVGVVTHSGGAWTLSVPWHTVALALKTAKELDGESVPGPEELEAVQRRKVYAFVTRGCQGCEFLKRDIKAGHFDRFNIEVIDYNRSAGTWSDGGKAFESFTEDTKESGTGLMFPVVWVEGTGQFKAGYKPERRGGLIGFIGSLLEGAIGLIAGESDRAVEFPNPYRRNRAGTDEPPEPGKEPAELPAVPAELEEKIAGLLADVDDIKNGNPFEKISALRSLRSDVEGMKGQITSAETKAALAADGAARLERMGISGIADDVKALKDGNVLQKVKALASLKGDVKAAVDGTKAELSELKQEKSTNPLHALWGLIGLVTGVIHEIKGRR